MVAALEKALNNGSLPLLMITETKGNLEILEIEIVESKLVVSCISIPYI